MLLLQGDCSIHTHEHPNLGAGKFEQPHSANHAIIVVPPYHVSQRMRSPWQATIQMFAVAGRGSARLSPSSIARAGNPSSREGQTGITTTTILPPTLLLASMGVAIIK
jgi:hypothetical protein